MVTPIATLHMLFVYAAEAATNGNLLINLLTYLVVGTGTPGQLAGVTLLAWSAERRHEGLNSATIRPVVVQRDSKSRFLLLAQKESDKKLAKFECWK